MVYEKFVDAWKNKGIKAYLDCYDEDRQINSHSTGRIMGLEELSDQLGNWMVTGRFGKHRCLYQNEDILVTHNIATFENGSREAIYNLTLKKMGYFGAQKRMQPLLKKRVIESQ